MNTLMSSCSYQYPRLAVLTEFDLVTGITGTGSCDPTKKRCQVYIDPSKRNLCSYQYPLALMNSLCSYEDPHVLTHPYALMNTFMFL